MWFTHYEKHHAGTSCIYVPVEQKEKNHMEEEQELSLDRKRQKTDK